MRPHSDVSALLDIFDTREDARAIISYDILEMGIHEVYSFATYFTPFYGK